ncbi:MAG: polar amino acid transport system substrate-binding protein [Desulforhopalus sp.]|jgi:polar amino acid transport system substrate-binding protein
MAKYHRHLLRSVAFISFFIAMVFLAEKGACVEVISKTKENTFTMSINRPAGTPLYKWVDLIYSEVFRRLDTKLRLVYYPLKRASKETNEGRVDGEPARIRTYNKLHRNLVRVEEPVFQMIVAAYKADLSIPKLNGWESLNNTDYSVAYPRGMKICENNLQEVIKPERLSNITETYQGLQMLALKRIDLYIDDVNSVSPFLKNGRNKIKGMVHLAGIMQEVPLYMYVHKKHKSLAPKLAEVIREIKDMGLIEDYYKKAFETSED